MNKRHEEHFREYVENSKQRHYRAAIVLTGNHHDAEDLVQHALVKLYQRWPRVSRKGSPDGYVRTTLTHRFIDTRRSASFRNEEQRADLPDDANETSLLADLAVDRILLRELLLALPPVEHAAVVMRYLDDLPVDQVAHALGYSRSQTNRHIRQALNRMSALAQEQAQEQEQDG